MRGAINISTNTPSWRGAQSKESTGTTLLFCTVLFNDVVCNSISGNQYRLCYCHQEWKIQQRYPLSTVCCKHFKRYFNPNACL